MSLWLLIMAALTTRLWSILLLVVVAVVATTLPSSQLSLPDCPAKCGEVDIPYPFGIGEGCYYNSTPDDHIYKITCNDTYSPSRPIYGTNIEVINISLLEGKMRINNYGSNRCYDNNGAETSNVISSLLLARFAVVSTSDNVFAAIGCDTYGWFEGLGYNRTYSTGCRTTCTSPQDVVNGTCSGAGCCQISIPDGITKISSIHVRSFNNHTDVISFNPCSSAFVVAKDVLPSFSLANLTTAQPPNRLPVVLEWMIGNQSCSTARASGNILCKANTMCDDKTTIYGYRCNCSNGFSGNPYSPQGCRDIDECADPTLNNCEKPAICENAPGNYTCRCPKGYHLSGDKSNRCEPNQKIPAIIFVVIGVCCGIVASILIVMWLYLQHRNRQLKKERDNFFRQNGGHLLHQKLSTGQDVSAAMIKIFTKEDLEKATNKYSDNNVIGRGGNGMVFKGVLANKQVVAIKRSLKVNPKQNEQFINEIILLSKLNHRNVVKLIGCCLEEEVPLLVYEFIDNGTLYHHLHEDPKASLLTWSIRLRIASQVANVLSYLHTAISMPIIHRDMKSLNILLDTNYTAKVSDFGDSRLVPMEQDYLSTALLGTRGYLDPEYVQSNELTSKSDVYSFGVVLVELLTGLKALSPDRSTSDMCLASFFLRKWKEGRWTEILDNKMSREDDAFQQVTQVANIAEKCLKVKSDERPTMEEVAMELHKVREMAGSVSLPKSSSMVPQQNTTSVEVNMSCSKGNLTDSSNHSQGIDHFAVPLESGR